MKPGWYQESRIKLIFEQAKEFATQEGLTGDAHRDRTRELVTESLGYE